MRHTISVFILLSFIWVSSSGFFTPLFLFYGLIAVAFVSWLAHRMDVIDHESQPVHLTSKLPAYYWWLLVKIIQGNIDVVKHIWQPKLAISPCTDVVEASQDSDMGKVIYANSITLTPGTVALNLDGGKIIVHSLTQKALAELQTGDMNRRVKALE